MDEPLSNLDAKLRIQMRTELIKLHKKIGATTIYVTHDQTEAMTMADRIVVMSNGYVQQIGTPDEIYNEPENLFVAGFLGSPQINLFDGEYRDGHFVFENGREIKLPEEKQKLLEGYEGKKLMFGIRPEDIYVMEEGTPFQIEVTEMLGHEYILYGNIEGMECKLRTPLNAIQKGDENVYVWFDLTKCHIFDKETERRIRQCD